MTGALRATDLLLLRTLASKGSMQRRVKVTSSSLAAELGVSQQAVSAALIRLQDRGLVERTLAARGQLVKLTKPGTSILRADYAAYKRLFEEEGRPTITGTVAAGLGEGAYYLGRKGYEDGLMRVLGSKPYRGTLNVKVSGGELETLESIRAAPGLEIPGFEEGGRTFGPIKCFRAEICGVAAVAVVPSRTHYTDTLEIVAPVRLRSSLELTDGSEVSVTITIA